MSAKHSSTTKTAKKYFYKDLLVLYGVLICAKDPSNKPNMRLIIEAMANGYGWKRENLLFMKTSS